jgi:hypothetical protein
MRKWIGANDGKRFSSIASLARAPAPSGDDLRHLPSSVSRTTSNRLPGRAARLVIVPRVRRRHREQIEPFAPADATSCFRVTGSFAKSSGSSIRAVASERA